MADERGIVTCHFIAHWGVPIEIRPSPVHGLEQFAILVFPPRGPRKTWRYATNGMSSRVQFHPDPQSAVRTELYACTEAKAAWMDSLLAAVAGYPFDYETYLAEGDTIDVGQPIDRDRSSFTGILLAPPGPGDPATLGLVGGLSENVLIHQVVGLMPGEVQYAAGHSGKLLWQMLGRRGETHLDVGRGSVV